MVLNSTRKLMRVGIGARSIWSHARRNAVWRSTSAAIGSGVGCHSAAKRAARRSAASLVPPIQIGGCGCCTGFGLTCISENEKYLPANETLPGAQQACHRRKYSLVRDPRSWNGTPSAENSASFQPARTPAISGPPDIWSIVAKLLAVATGLRYGIISTETPTPIWVVCAAINDIATNGS